MGAGIAAVFVGVVGLAVACDVNAIAHGAADPSNEVDDGDESNFETMSDANAAAT